ncbi:NAD(P)-binding protein [Lepidopterella palustris CBS 459.81]|uniref:NAD(P)-binding protein n=1 Tax=Lepidopterella palustris CBS 459.81 TaxID=1314670 RepID=A0A8E2JK38_9PEZI|nr:NAD(P)-binding protein [Lepidopterella palustris CBS 459.81]
MTSYWNALVNQSIWIPRPSITEKNVQDLTGKVLLVTGGNTGVGFQLCKILYSANGTVYLAARSVEKGTAAIEKIKAAHPTSKGRIELLKLDLGDLTTIKASAQDFLARESRLDVLWNNAGVMMPPNGSVTEQGHELQMGTNCLAPYLFTEFLKPILKATAANAPANSVRVAWAGSAGIDFLSPSGGIQFDEGGRPKVLKSNSANYGQSKAGNLFLAEGFAKEMASSGIVSVVFNPGNLHTELNRHIGASEWLQRILLYPAIYGAYTELYCGVSPELTVEDNGIYIAPWGRKSYNRSDIETARKDGTVEKFMRYCNAETEKYM